MLDLNQHHQAGGSGEHEHDPHGHGPLPLSVTEELRGMNISTVNDAGAEYGLAALRDSPSGVKPFYPYSTLIRESLPVPLPFCSSLSLQSNPQAMPSRALPSRNYC